MPVTSRQFMSTLLCDDWVVPAGAKVTEETSWLAGLVMNIVFLLGLFT
jgi:hypothetical protein